MGILTQLKRSSLLALALRLVLSCLVVSTYLCGIANAMTKTELLNELQLVKLQSGETPLQKRVIDNLIFYVDSHYKNEAEKSFLADASEKIAQREIQNPQTLNTQIWRYFNDLAEVLRRDEGSNTPPGVLLKAYLKYSPLESPKDPKDFITEANYSNGRDYQNVGKKN